MRIARIGPLGRERAAVILGQSVIYVDSVISDWTRIELENGAVKVSLSQVKDQ